MSTFLCKNGVRKEYFLTPTFIIEPFYYVGGPYEVKCILQAYFDLERGTVPATMRNGAGMWDCAGASAPFAYICCG